MQSDSVVVVAHLRSEAKNNQERNLKQEFIIQRCYHLRLYRIIILQYIAGKDLLICVDIVRISLGSITKKKMKKSKNLRSNDLLLKD